MQIREWLFTIGYTLSYGAVLAKLWRVYTIFNNPAPNKRVSHIIHMEPLIGFVLRSRFLQSELIYQ